MRLMTRLKQWSDLQKVRPTEEWADVAGGRDGELLLKGLVSSSFQFKDAHLLTGRRIPSKRQGRRREIDLIVCTPRMIHLIEVKHWSGRLEIRHGTWHQTRRGGDVVEHGNLIETNQLKLEAVLEYLHDRGLDLDDRLLRNHITPKIIFTNPNLQLEPAIEARPDVISRRELDNYLGRQPPKKYLAESMFASLIEFCLDWESGKPGRGKGEGQALGQPTSAPIASGQYRRIVAWLEEAGTWDQLQLYGGRSVAGDLVSLRVGGTTYRSAELRVMAGQDPLRLRWTRSGFRGLLKAVTGLGSLGNLTMGRTRLRLAPTDTVMFHAVGERETMNRKLGDVEQIILG